MSIEKLNEAQLRCYEFDITEEQEEWIGNNSLWLAGMMTCSGWLGFRVQDGYAYPTLSFVNQDVTRLAQMKELLGGSVVPVSKNGQQTYRLDIRRGEHIRWLTSLVKPHTPTLEPIIDEIEEWSNTTDREERVAIAQNASNLKDARLQIARTISYNDLVRNPQFMAGVVDAKVAFYFTRTTPTAVIYDTNESLLQSIAKVYGGGVRLIAPAGTDFAVNEGSGSPTTHNSYSCTLYGAPAVYGVLHKTQAYTRLTEETEESMVLLQQQLAKRIVHRFNLSMDRIGDHGYGKTLHHYVKDSQPTPEQALFINLNREMSLERIYTILRNAGLEEADQNLLIDYLLARVDATFQHDLEADHKAGWSELEESAGRLLQRVQGYLSRS